MFSIDLWPFFVGVNRGLRPRSSEMLCRSLVDWLLGVLDSADLVFINGLCRMLSFDSMSVSPKKRRFFVGVGLAGEGSSSSLVRAGSLSSLNKREFQMLWLNGGEAFKENDTSFIKS